MAKSWLWTGACARSLGKRRRRQADCAVSMWTTACGHKMGWWRALRPTWPLSRRGVSPSNCASRQTSTHWVRCCTPSSPTKHRSLGRWTPYLKRSFRVILSHRAAGHLLPCHPRSWMPLSARRWPPPCTIGTTRCAHYRRTYRHSWNHVPSVWFDTTPFNGP